MSSIFTFYRDLPNEDEEISINDCRKALMAAEKNLETLQSQKRKIESTVKSLASTVFGFGGLVVGLLPYSDKFPDLTFQGELTRVDEKIQACLKDIEGLNFKLLADANLEDEIEEIICKFVETDNSYYIIDFFKTVLDPNCELPGAADHREQIALKIKNQTVADRIKIFEALLQDPEFGLPVPFNKPLIELLCKAAGDSIQDKITILKSLKPKENDVNALKYLKPEEDDIESLKPAKSSRESTAARKFRIAAGKTLKFNVLLRYFSLAPEISAAEKIQLSDLAVFNPPYRAKSDQETYIMQLLKEVTGEVVDTKNQTLLEFLVPIPEDLLPPRG